jgi:excinuclease ABC subunit C
MIDLDKIPKSPGCYLFKNKSGIIIYIGKAKNLKKRVSNYFQKKDHDSKTKILVSNISSIDFIATDNEIEALILENNLIKKYMPKYNIDLKDSKRYAYLKLTNEEYPRLILSRNKNEKGKFFGPFVSGQAREHIKEIVTKTFMIRTCKKIPKKSCLRFHLNLCSAPCINHISKKNYLNNIKNTEMVLSGKIKELSLSLNKQMRKAATGKNYELALQLKQQIKSLANLTEKQNMERIKKYDEDIINFIILDNKVYLMLFNVYKGILENMKSFVFDYSENFFEEFILQYYSDESIPNEIILPKKITKSLNEYLTKLSKKKIKITVPIKGEKHKLLILVKKNLTLKFFAKSEKLLDLKIKLGLIKVPKVIECFDISHLSGTSTVGSMVQFKDSKPNKSNYRRFKIKTVEEINDVAAIAEVVKRRYSRLIKENKELPDLIIIDGGKGQLNGAYAILNELGLNIPIISIAKRLEEIFFPKLEEGILLNKKSLALRLVQEIRDEAHRFAINYNRLLRKKEIYK